MIFLSQAQIDALLLEDIQGGDLTTRALNIGHQHGYIEFFLRQGGCVSGVSVACKMLTTLGLTIDDAVSDGSQANAGQRLIRAQGNAAALHQGWKAVQNVLEWSCGVSDYLAQMLALLRERYPDGNIACTRKAINFRVSRSRTAPLAELCQFFHGELAGQCQSGIQHRACGKYTF